MRRLLTEIFTQTDMQRKQYYYSISLLIKLHETTHTKKTRKYTKLNSLGRNIKFLNNRRWIVTNNIMQFLSRFLFLLMYV